jgi:hypothetical protein
VGAGAPPPPPGSRRVVRSTRREFHHGPGRGEEPTLVLNNSFNKIFRKRKDGMTIVRTSVYTAKVKIIYVKSLTLVLTLEVAPGCR